MLRSWRVSQAEPSGCHVWFDPERTEVRLYELEPPKDEGVPEVSEGDDQIGFWDSRDQVNELVDRDELPF